MKLKEMTIEQLLERRAAIAVELENDDADLNALSEEARAITAEIESRRAAEAQREEIRKMVANGAGEPVARIPVRENEREQRARALKETGRMTASVEETRAILISSETLATPTQVSDIHDAAESDPSSLLQYVLVEDCEGMGSDKVPYEVESAGAAADQTEGSEAVTKEPTFDYVTITPTSVACKAQISKQTRKQTPLKYEAKVRESAGKSLRKAAVNKLVAALKASTLTQEYVAEVSSSKGAITENTLSELYLSYLGEGVPTLLLTRADLQAFGKVRGTNEKKRLYTIRYGENPNVGTIEEDGIACRFIVIDALTSCAGTAQTAAKQKTMFFGDMKTLKLDLFSKMDIEVSHDFAITSLMDTIVGDTEIGCDVVAKNTIIAVTIPASA